MLVKQCLVVYKKSLFSKNPRKVIATQRGIEDFVYTLRAKDPGILSHWHIYLNFGDLSFDTKTIASWFGIKERQVQKHRGSMSDAVAYMLNDVGIVANFDVSSELRATDIIGNFECFSYEAQLRFIDTLPHSEKIRMFKKLNALHQIHLAMERFQSKAED